MPPPTDPPSPCISICRLDENGLCEGCLRSIDEIAGWGSLPADRKRAILLAVDVRRAARASTGQRIDPSTGEGNGGNPRRA